MAQPGSFVWTRRQRAVLASIVLILCAAFFVQALRHPTRIDDPPAPTGDLANALATRIDPNTADWPAWAGLPLIGEKRAREIVAFREQWRIDHPDQLPFEKPEDLTRIKGIGKATVETLKPYLIFPPADSPPP
jgi:DNA uptake protein ComE-like DNA-binding protein